MKRKSDRNWKNIFVCVTIIIMISLFFTNTYAQTNMSVGAGIDIMLPVGSFADHWVTGFGGTGEFDYIVTPRTSITGKIGYLTWSGKNLPDGVSATYSGVPLLVGAKYYLQFIPKDLPFRLYGHLELGVMFGSVSTSGSTQPITTEGGTDFTLAPSGGMEIPVSTDGAIDLSIRYFSISSKASIGLRGGFKMNF